MAPAHLFPSAFALTDLERFYREVRQTSERLGAPLSDADAMVQSMPDASPAKWRLAHTTWFFEAMVLSPHLKGYEPAARAGTRATRISSILGLSPMSRGSGFVFLQTRL